MSSEERDKEKREREKEKESRLIKDTLDDAFCSAVTFCNHVTLNQDVSPIPTGPVHSKTTRICLVCHVVVAFVAVCLFLIFVDLIRAAKMMHTHFVEEQ